MSLKTRRELQRLFKTGAKPSNEDFKDFIDSTLNIKDDGLENPAGAEQPLKISAQGADEKLLDFYSEDTKSWSISQRPTESNPGFNISNSSGSKLFIASSNGNVGINTINPTAKLEIRQTGNEDALRIDDEVNDTTPFIVKNDGKVGIGTTNPTALLQVEQTGNEDALRIDDEVNDTTPLIVKSDGKVGIGTTNPTALLQVEQTGNEDALRINDSANDSTPLIVKSDGKVGIGTTNPTALLQVEQTGNEDALRINDSANDSTPLIVKSDGKVGIGTTNPTALLQVAGTLKANSIQGDGAVVTGMIMMWSGTKNNIPAGWALCNGSNNTPDLRNRFIVGAGSTYNVNARGGNQNMTLTKDQMPRHSHVVNDNGHSHSYSKVDATPRRIVSSGSTESRYGIRTDPRQSSSSMSHISINYEGQGRSFDNRPPYFALCFIMKT